MAKRNSTDRARQDRARRRTRELLATNRSTLSMYAAYFVVLFRLLVIVAEGLDFPGLG